MPEKRSRATEKTGRRKDILATEGHGISRKKTETETRKRQAEEKTETETRKRQTEEKAF